MLIRHGVRLDAERDTNVKLLHFAVEEGRYRVANILIDADAVRFA